MSLLKRVGWRRGALALAVATLLIVVATQTLSDEPEIALLIGEPWENMRKRSTAAIDPAIAGHFWGRLPKSDARLRFIDPQYGFITPLARYFTVTFNRDESINGVNMSPQIEPLLLDDTSRSYWICKSNGVQPAGYPSASKKTHHSLTLHSGEPNCATRTRAEHPIGMLATSTR